MADFRDIHRELDKIRKAIQQDIPEIVGTEAVNHFTENFENQSFDGKDWPEVERRKPTSPWYGFELGSKTKKPSNHPSRHGTRRKYKKRKNSPQTNYSINATKRPILSSKRSELENSIRYKVRGSRVVVFSDKEYASVHNEGENIRVFGGRSVKMPKRQFIGKSTALERRIIKKINEHFNKLL